MYQQADTPYHLEETAMELAPRDMPARLPWTGTNSPHGTIEVNHACNITCHACYKDKRGSSKGLQEIKHEIDLLMKLRRVGSLTLAGGEPSLHPRLTEIISYIRSKGVRPLLLSNGTTLTPENLRRWKDAGLERIFIHIDQRQQNRPDRDVYLAAEPVLNQLREHYVRMGAQAGVDVSPSVTLYRERLDDFCETVRFCLANPHVNILLVTDYAQILNRDNREDDGLSVTNKMVYETLARDVNIFPSWYVPSTHRDRDPRWMVYLSAVTTSRNGRLSIFHFHPRHRTGLRLLPRLSRFKYRRYSFDDPFTRLDSVVSLIVYGLLSFNPAILVKSLAFAFRAVFAGKVKVLRMCFQQGPNLREDGSYESCFDCPDAVVRNGKLVNLCLVDQLEPLPNCTP